jgi:hypothetical protein
MVLPGVFRSSFPFVLILLFNCGAPDVIRNAFVVGGKLEVKTHFRRVEKGNIWRRAKWRLCDSHESGLVPYRKGFALHANGINSCRIGGYFPVQTRLIVARLLKAKRRLRNDSKRKAACARHGEASRGSQRANRIS